MNKVLRSENMLGFQLSAKELRVFAAENKFVKYAVRAALIAFYLCIALFLYYSSLEELIGMIRAENSYALLFFLAFFGGLTTFSGVPYHIVLVGMAAGGLNPILLGASASFGVMLGDTTSYYIGYHGRAIAPSGMQTFFQRLYAFAAGHQKALPLFCFLYGALVPFSNDVITISAGFARYPFWKIMVPLGLGNVVFNVSLAFIAVYGYGILVPH